MTRPSPQPYVPVVCLMAVAGCGDPIATGAYRPPYVILAGNLTIPKPAPTTDPVSIALLWFNTLGGKNHSGAVLFDPIEAPASFKAGVSELPPPEALYQLPMDVALNSGLDPDMKWAVATLLVYQDNNHNGILDLVDPGAGSSPDRILGAASDYDLFYLAQGRPAASQWLGTYPTATGFSLVREPALRDPLPFDCDQIDGDVVFAGKCDQVALGDPQLLPITAPMEIAFSGAPALERFACDTFWGAHDYPDWSFDPSLGCFGTRCPLDLPPAGASVVCAGDNTAYVYKTCSANAALCGTNLCHFGHGARVATDPIPAGWPCPPPS